MTDFDITSNGNIKVIGTNNGSIYIQNTNQPRKITGHAGFISSIAVSSNNQRFVSGSRDWIKLWDLQKGEILEVLEGESPKLTSLKINSPEKTLYCGDYQEFTIQGFDQYNKPIKIENITWTATGGEVEDGLFQAGNISGSNFKIQAQVNSVSCQVLITILEKPKLTSLKINPSETSLYCGKSQQFNVQGFDQYNQPIPIGQVTWTATGGTINQNGYFIPLEDADGSYEVYAKAIPENISDLAEFKVIPVPKIKDVYVSSDFRDINSDQPLFISEVIEKVSDTIEDVREKLDNSFNATNRETAVEYSDNQLLNKKSYSDFKSKENFDHDSDSDSEYNEDFDNDSETNEDSYTEFYSPLYRIKVSLSYQNNQNNWFYRSQLFYDGYYINDNDNDVETYADYLAYQDFCSFCQYDQD